MTQKTLRIAFMGTPDFAVPALKMLHESEHKIICTYTQPPRPKGRGHKVQPSPVHIYSEQHGIPVFYPKSLKKPPEQEAFIAHQVDIAVVAAYGLILPKIILNAPQYGCINIHASLLPRWRGASPIQHAIWKGDSKSGVTIMQMNAGLDTGPEIEKQEITLSSDTTAQQLHDSLSEMGGEMIIKAIDQLAKHGVLKSTPQDDTLSCYAPMLKKEDGLINWNNNAPHIDRQIRALNPWPGTYIKDFKIRNAILSETTTKKSAGTILDKAGHIACGNGTVLQIKSLQPAGKKPMDFISAINGGYVAIGQKFL